MKSCWTCCRCRWFLRFGESTSFACNLLYIFRACALDFLRCDAHTPLVSRQGWKQIELFCDKCDTRQEQWEPFFFLDLEISGESLQEIQHMSSQSSLFSIVALQPGVSRCLQEGRHAWCSKACLCALPFQAPYGARSWFKHGKTNFRMFSLAGHLLAGALLATPKVVYANMSSWKSRRPAIKAVASDCRIYASVSLLKVLLLYLKRFEYLAEETSPQTTAC